MVTDNGKGVMFYNTGADYNPTTGAPDASDAIDPFNQSPPAADPAGNFGPITLAGNAAHHDLAAQYRGQPVHMASCTISAGPIPRPWASREAPRIQRRGRFTPSGPP